MLIVMNSLNFGIDILFRSITNHIHPTAMRSSVNDQTILQPENTAAMLRMLRHLDMHPSSKQRQTLLFPKAQRLPTHTPPTPC